MHNGATTNLPNILIDQNIHFDIKFQSEISEKKKLCIFSSFSFDGQIEEYVFYYLDHLKKANFSIVFVSTSNITKDCTKRLSTYAFLILERENKCPDFGSWKLGLSLLNWGSEFESVLLTNDSIFGPLQSLSTIISSMNDRYDIWGLTGSYEIDYHLQSYFLVFNNKVLLSTTWKKFWASVNVTLSKQEVINQYEVGLTKFFQHDFKIGVYAEIENLSNSSKHDHKYINPTLGFWKILIELYNFPFFKREILIRPYIDKIYWDRGLYINIGNWRKIISEKAGYPVELIDLFINRYATLIKQKNKDLILQKRKILFLTHNIELGGAQRVLINFLRWFKNSRDIPFEVIVCRDGEKSLENEFNSLCALTFFQELNPDERQKLKTRLTEEQIAMVFSNTMVNGEVMKFLSFLDVPQIVFAHELPYVLNQFSSVTNNVDWFRNNVNYFIGCSLAVSKSLVDYLKIDTAQTSVVHEFIEFSEESAKSKEINELKSSLNIPENAFVVGMSGTFEWRKSADLLPVIARSLCNYENDIHIIWLGVNKNLNLYKDIASDISKAELGNRVHLIEKSHTPEIYFQLFDIFLMISREDPFPLVNLESGAAGKPVICFKGSGGSEEYVELGTGYSVPYLDINSLVIEVQKYYTNRHTLRNESEIIKSIVRKNFSTDVQAPKIFDVISKFYDEEELRMLDQPTVTIMTHIFFDYTWGEMKSSIKHFDNGVNHFLFSISEVCLAKDLIISDIKKTFRNSYTIITPNVGRDIGSKFALIDLYLLLGIKSTYIIFLHDKQSLHTLVGESWKKNLFKILDPANQKEIVNLFKSGNVGIVGAAEHFINEFDSSTGVFRHNNDLSKIFLDRYKISIDNYEYISGTIYWLRSDIVEQFFGDNNPISLRNDLESGNILDNKVSTKVHTWERMFCWIATKYGYTIKGF